MAMTMIRELRKAKGLSLETLAFDSEISVSQVSRYETGERDPKLSDLERIARRLDVRVSTLLGEITTVAVPIVSWVSAGRMATTENVASYDVSRTLHFSDLPPGDWIGLIVRGDSMDRIAAEGSIILVNRADTILVQSKFFVISTEDGEANFKRYRAKPARLQPYSTNPDH